jgi:biotin-(acetyl-CoA carboxylase) ligase
MTVDREVTVLRGDERAPAFAEAITDNGSLLVRYPDGRAEALQSGEVSLRIP